MIGVLLNRSEAPFSATAPRMLLALVVPLAGPTVIEDPVALMVLPEPLARSPICPAAVAVVVEVVLSKLPLKRMVLPDCASVPVVAPAARLIVMLFPVICPSAPEAFRPTALRGLTLTVVPAGTVQPAFGLPQAPSRFAPAPGRRLPQPTRL